MTRRHERTREEMREHGDADRAGEGSPRITVDEALDNLRDAPRKVAHESAVEHSRVTRKYLIVVAAIVVIGIGAFAFLAWQTDRNTRAIRDIVTVQIDAGLGASRANNLADMRHALSGANDERVRYGLERVPDPGPGSSALEVAVAVGEARGSLRAMAEMRARGVPIDGVTVPDPSSGRFPVFRGSP